jgi:hypothetical protein
VKAPSGSVDKNIAPEILGRLTIQERSSIMSVGAVSFNNSSATVMPGGMNGAKQDFKALQDALNAGDLSGAQKAFSSIEQDFQNIQKARGAQANSQTGGGQLQQDFQAIQNALNAGDIDGAKQALATFQQDVKKAHGHHHHHHHHKSDSTTDSSDPSSGSSGTADPSSPVVLLNSSGNTSTGSATGSLVNLVA